MLAFWIWHPVSVVPALLLLFLLLIRPAVSRRRPATESSVMALGLMMKPPWLYQFSSISRSPPPSLPPPETSDGYGTLYESVASIMLKSAPLCSIFPPSVVSQSQLSVCCVARRAAGDSSLVVELSRGKDERREHGWGGRTVVTKIPASLGYVRFYSASPLGLTKDCLYLRRWTTHLWRGDTQESVRYFISSHHKETARLTK